MKRLLVLGLVAMVFFLLTGGNCSRARVESMNLMNEGVVAARSGRHLQAVEFLEKATAIDPTNEQAFYNLALVHIEMRKFERAKQDLNRAIAVEPELAGYQEKLGTVLMQLEDWTAAKEAFEKAVAIDPTLFKANFKLGQVAEHLDDQQTALQNYTEAAKKGPRFIPAYSSLGRLYADLDYLDHAAQVLQAGLQVAPEGSEDAANLHHLLGTVYQQQRKYDEAVAQFRAALDIVPGMNDTLFSLGWTYQLVGNREEARRFLKKYVDVAGAEAPSHYVRAARDKLYQLGEGQ